MKTGRLMLYLRREPTVDDVWLKYGDGRTKYDVRAYRDRACTRLACLFGWFGRPPRRGCKTTMMDCYRWAVEWLLDATEQPKARNL
jgi:hypothetical protein